MPSPEVLLAGIMLLALTFYALLGGADFGGGVWDLLARGPRAQQQRALIAEAIGPIWEANHVWLILVIVLLFTAFPAAFAAITTALNIPLTLMLIGIVLRGTAFTFRTYDSSADNVQRRWGRIFAIASCFTPLMLGICIGAIASGRIVVENGVLTTGFFAAWLTPFAWAVGGFALALFAFLAAVYLTVEASTPSHLSDPDVHADQHIERGHALQDDFRRRALLAAVAVGAMALLVFLLSGAGAPRVRAGLSTSPWAWPLQISTGLAALGAIWALWTWRFYLARPRCRAGDADPLGLGRRAVPLFGRAGDHDPERGCPTGDYAAAADRASRRRSASVPIFLFPIPHLQGQGGVRSRGAHTGAGRYPSLRAQDVIIAEGVQP